MFYVYLIQSKSNPEKRYIGFTEDVKARLKAHNNGLSKHTAKFYPWELMSYHAFKEKRTGRNLNTILKPAPAKLLQTKDSGKKP